MALFSIHTTHRSALLSAAGFCVSQGSLKLTESWNKEQKKVKSIDMGSDGSESKPLAIKYCLLSACAACCSILFALIGICLITQKSFQDFAHNTITVTGILFLSLALLSSIMAVIFKRLYKYHYDRNIITSHGPLYAVVNYSGWHKYWIARCITCKSFLKFRLYGHRTFDKLRHSLTASNYYRIFTRNIPLSLTIPIQLMIR